jgi:hypothetical protein
VTVPVQNGLVGTRSTSARLGGAMPDGLTFQATLVLVVVALGLAFGVQVLVGAGASSGKPKARQRPALVQSTPGSAVELLTAARAVPALRASRAPQKGRVQPQRPTPVAGRAVTPALTLVAAPVSPAESARPAPTAVPREVAPAPLRVAPAPKPKPEPAPTSTPESRGRFDTTGGSGTADDFDTRGAP